MKIIQLDDNFLLEISYKKKSVAEAWSTLENKTFRIIEYNWGYWFDFYQMGK